jgi:hypothetical protein
MTAVIVWIVFSALVGLYADSKNRSGIGYVFLSLLLSPLIGFFVVAIAGEKKND